MTPHATQQLLAGYLLNAAWQAPVVAFCAFLGARFGGLGPAARNRLWLGALAAAAILPAVSLADLLPHSLPTVARVAPSAAIGAQASLPAVAADAAEPALRLDPAAGWMMIGLLALVPAVLALRLTMASAAARRLVREARPATLPPEVTRALERLAGAHGRTVPPVRSAPGLHSPAVVGVFSPVILLPEAMAAQPQDPGDDLRAALLHELAHVLRHDYAVNVACEVLTLPVCWHPATLAIKAGVRRSRELACDAIAARAMGSPKAYARRLVSLAQSLGQQTSTPSSALAGAALAVGLFGRSDLEDRLMNLLKPADDEGAAVRTARLCGLAAVGASLLASAALLHVTPVFAQPAQVAAAPPAATVSARQALADAGAVSDPAPSSERARQRSHVIISRKGVIIGAGGHSHSWTAADGRPITVINDNPNDPSPAQQREWEAAARDAEAQGAAAEALVNSPEFKARIANAKAAGEAARRMTESPEFKAEIARARAAGEAASKMTESAEFKAQIAEARAAGEAARKMTESPEFKAQIAEARAQGEAARKLVDSPEFKARLAKIRGDAAELQRRIDRIGAEDDATPAP
jgi:beta-lactamase regulating signal transducer with metallopeptidase domain